MIRKSFFSERRKTDFSKDEIHWNYESRPPCSFSRCGLAVSVSIAAILADYYLKGIVIRDMFALPFMAVLISSIYGGFWSGALSVVVLAPALAYFFIEPVFSFKISNPDKIIDLLVFVLSAVAVAWASKWWRRSKLHEENEERYRALADSMPQIAWMNRPDGTLTFLNKRWYEYTGIKKTGESPALVHLSSRVHPDQLEPLCRSFMRALSTNKSFELEYLLQRADGRYRWFLGRMVPVFDSSNRVRAWFATATDIHEQKLKILRLQEERETREKALLAISHDLRTPLTVINLGSHILSKNENLSEQQKEVVGRITSNVSRLERMMRELQGPIQEQPTQDPSAPRCKCNLKRVVEAALNCVKTIYGERFVFDAEKSVFGDWSADDLQRVVENLASNAAKYGAPRAPITVSLEESESFACIIVHNEGEPIAPERRDQLLNGPARLRLPHSAENESWGVGLAVVRGIVESHQGTLSVESSADHGTCFSVRLPKQVSPASDSRMSG